MTKTIPIVPHPIRPDGIKPYDKPAGGFGSLHGTAKALIGNPGAQALATLPRQEGDAAPPAGQHALPATNFSEWFKQTIEKLNG